MSSSSSSTEGSSVSGSEESTSGETSSDSSEGYGSSTKKIEDLGYQVSATAGMLRNVTREYASDNQNKVRIFVGSNPWSNDRWDSGEIASGETTEMEYGGGDNLIKGHKYWVHIMTYHPDTGWSRPQIRDFVVPR
jgi:hypothetical protein